MVRSRDPRTRYCSSVRSCRNRYHAKDGTGRVYVFGGHGGVNYERKAFNDISYLDIETFEWTKLEPAG